VKALKSDCEKAGSVLLPWGLGECMIYDKSIIIIIIFIIIIIIIVNVPCNIFFTAARTCCSEQKIFT
jgi:hypothetical protein